MLLELLYWDHLNVNFSNFSHTLLKPKRADNTSLFICIRSFFQTRDTMSFHRGNNIPAILNNFSKRLIPSPVQNTNHLFSWFPNYLHDLLCYLSPYPLLILWQQQNVITKATSLADNNSIHPLVFEFVNLLEERKSHPSSLWL